MNHAGESRYFPGTVLGPESMRFLNPAPPRDKNYLHIFNLGEHKEPLQFLPPCHRDYIKYFLFIASRKEGECRSSPRLAPFGPVHLETLGKSSVCL